MAARLQPCRLLARQYFQVLHLKFMWVRTATETSMRVMVFLPAKTSRGIFLQAMNLSIEIILTFSHVFVNCAYFILICIWTRCYVCFCYCVNFVCGMINILLNCTFFTSLAIWFNSSVFFSTSSSISFSWPNLVLNATT